MRKYHQRAWFVLAVCLNLQAHATQSHTSHTSQSGSEQVGVQTSLSLLQALINRFATPLGGQAQHQPHTSKEKEKEGQQGDLLTAKIAQWSHARLQRLTQPEGKTLDLVYVPTQGSLLYQGNPEAHFDLKQRVLDYLNEPRVNDKEPWKVLALLGDSGAGKTTFTQKLEQQLWDKWQGPKDYLPLWIDLPTLKKHKKKVIHTTLKRQGFTNEEIKQLRQNYRFLLMLDAYDELMDYTNVYQANQLNKWHGRVIITSRVHYFNRSRHGDRLYPLDPSTKLPIYSQGRTLYVAPFSAAQRQQYIEQYIKSDQRQDATDEKEQQLKQQWRVQDYETAIEQMPELGPLLHTPLLLRLIVPVLPQLRQQVQGGNGQYQTSLVTINTVYEAFMEHWFDREIDKQEKRLRSQQTKNKPFEGFALHERQQKKRELQDFVARLAHQMHLQGLLHLDQETIKGVSSQRNPWNEFFAKENGWLLRAAPLMRVDVSVQKDNQQQSTQQQPCWSFLHASLQLYYANKVGADLFRQQENEKDEKFEQEKLERLIQSMNLRLEEPNMLEFRAGAIRATPNLKQAMFTILERSKKDKKVTKAAANAITALNVAGVAFSGRDFANVRIAGAILDGASLDHANLTRANLNYVSLAQADLHNAVLRQARMKRVRFGEYPTLTQGHIDSVTSVSFSPDGTRLASASSDKTVRVWDVSSSSQLKVLRGHMKGVNSVSFSPDGTRVASVSLDKTVRLWDVRSGQLLNVLQGHTSSVNSVSFSPPDGTRLASASKDGTVRLWDVRSGKQLNVLQGHTGTVWSVSFSPDGTRLASASGDLYGKDNTVRLWDVSSGKQLNVLGGHAASVNSVSFSPNGKRLASAGADKTVRVWDAVSGRHLKVLWGHTDRVSSVVFSPGGKRLASASWDETVRLWDVSSGQQLKTLQGHTSYINSVRFSPDGTRLASASLDKMVRLWDASSGQQLKTLQGHTSGVNSVRFSPDGKHVASGSRDKTVRLWDVRSGQQLKLLQGHTSDINSVRFSSDGRHLASASSDKTVRLWDVSSSSQLKVLRGHMKGVNSVSFSPDGTRVASASWDCTVRLWDVNSGRQLKVLRGHTAYVNSVRFSPDGTRLASASGNSYGSSTDNTVRLWDVSSGRELKQLKGHTREVHSVRFSPDGTRLASASSDKTVRMLKIKIDEELHVEATLQWVGRQLGLSLWQADLRGVMGLTDVQRRLVQEEHGGLVGPLPQQSEPSEPLVSGYARKYWPMWPQELLTKDHKDRFTDIVKQIHTYGKTAHAGSMASLAVAPNGKHVVSGGLHRQQGIVKVWDPKQPKEYQQQLKPWLSEGHTATVTSVASNPQEGLIASASRDGTIKLWDTKERNCLQTLRGHEGAVTHVAFSPQGDLLASVSEDHTVKLWDTKELNCLQTLRGHEGAVTHVAFSPQGDLLASTGEDGRVKLWQQDADKDKKEQWACKESFTADKDAVTSIVVSNSKNNRKLLTGGADGAVKLWQKNTKNGKWQMVRELKGHQDDITQVALSPDGKLIASASRDETVRLWDAKADKLLGTLLHEDKVNALAFYPSKSLNLLVTAGADGILRLWDINQPIKPKLMQELAKRHDKAINSVIFHSDVTGATGVISGGEDDCVVFWTFNSKDIETSEPIKFAHQYTDGGL